MLSIVLANECPASVYRVLIGLWTVAERGNAIHVSAAEMARQLGMCYGSCYRAWKYIVAKGWLLEERNARGRLLRYRLSPKLAWRGRPWTAMKVQASLDAARALTTLAQHDS